MQTIFSPFSTYLLLYLQSRFEEESQSFFDQSRPLRCSDSVPPEEKKATTPGSSKGHHLTARDVYGFGRLALEALAKGRDANGDEGGLFFPPYDFQA